MRVCLHPDACETLEGLTRAAGRDRETGGLLFGVTTAAAVMVFRASGPNPHQPLEGSDFHQDATYQQGWADAMMAVLELEAVGDWHSHPCTAPGIASPHDLSEQARLAGVYQAPAWLLFVLQDRGPDGVNLAAYLAGEPVEVSPWPST
ncbi:MAG TPA: Mov34/MPN/PAD-1 family protein [Deinococcales bacterium]|nr:Mov34/MPN/PAD-1 family protein [Deinococcales bacterium]